MLALQCALPKRPLHLDRPDAHQSLNPDQILDVWEQEIKETCSIAIAGGDVPLLVLEMLLRDA